MHAAARSARTESRRWRPVRSGDMAIEVAASRRDAEPKAAGRTLSGEPIRELYTEADLPAGIGAAARGGSDRPAGLLPVHARSVRVDVPRAAVDDAPVRRVRHERGDQRALPLPARARPDGAVDGVRHAVADGPRLGSLALAGRGRTRGRGGGHARRHADALRRHRRRRGERVDDDQRARGDHARLLRRRRRARRRRSRRRRARASDWRARSRRTSSRSTSPRRSGAFRSTPRCACAGT